jgi:Putative phage tail protein
MSEKYTLSDELIKGAGGRRRGGGSPPPPPPPPPPHTPVEADEGIVIEGAKKLSRTETEVADLICEGPIEGLVRGRYVYGGNLGNVGWSSANFMGYAGAKPELRSVYWKQVPLIDDAGNYNYQYINFKADYGTQTSATYLESNLSSLTPTNSYDSLPYASRTLNINEPLRYGSDFKKIIDLRSKNVNKIIVAIKIDALYDQQSDPNLDRVEYAGGYKQSTTVGDIRDRNITYNFKVKKLSYNNSSGFSENVVIDRNDSSSGKITSGFLHRFDFDVSQFYNPNTEESSFVGWRVEITRTSAESKVINLRDLASVATITEIFAEKFIYPKVGIFRSLFTTEYFSQVPPRAYDVKLLKVKIPSNYDPIMKTYNGDWDGRFSDEYHQFLSPGLHWTDNPAWCYYDLLTNNRYGLGKYIKNYDIDKWNLYQIAKYCDTLVSDGYSVGGLEPRFTCNTIVNDFSDAFSLVNDFASIFRGLSYYANGLIYATADMPKEPSTLFTNSNVENGEFIYSSSSRKVRNTVAVVRWNDMSNFAKPTIEYAEDPEGLRKYGVRKIEITAFGCTSRGQAYRIGKWALASEQYETETVNFTLGYDALYLSPGDIVKIQDRNRTIDRLGGRVLGIKTTPSSHEFILDQPYSDLTGYLNAVSASKYKFNILTPTSKTTGTTYNDFITGYQRSEIQTGSFSINNISGISGYNPNPDREITRITCNKLFDTTNYALTTGTVWTIEQIGSASNFYLTPETELFKIISITENESHRFNINAIEYNPSKYAAIESGISFAEAPTVDPGSTVILDAGTPSSFDLTSYSNELRISGIIGPQTEPTSGPGAKQTSYWKIFAKTGSDFNGGDLDTMYYNNQGGTVQVPKNDFQIGTIAVGNPSSFGIDALNGNYYFRAYGLNSYGYISSTYRAGSPNPITFQNTNLDDATNFITLSNFEYSTSKDTTQTVDVVLNRFQDYGINLNWKINNLYPLLKTWVAKDLEFRIDYITGNFSENNIYASTFTGFSSNNGANISYAVYPNQIGNSGLDFFATLPINSFYIAIDSRTGAAGKWTSQSTPSSNRFTNPNGFLKGYFENLRPYFDLMPGTTNDYTLSASLNADNNFNLYTPGLITKYPDIKGGFVFYTPNDEAKLDQQYITNIISGTLSDITKSWIAELYNSGIQVREFFMGAEDSFTTASSFYNNGNPIKNGFIHIKPYDTLINEWLNFTGYDRDFTYLNQDPYFRYPNPGNLVPITRVQFNRKLIDQVLALNWCNNGPIAITGALNNVMNTSEIMAMSGYLQTGIDTVSGNLKITGYNLDTKINTLSGWTVFTTGDQAISGNKTFLNDINISGNLTVSGTLKYNEIIDITVTGDISGYTGRFTQIYTDDIQASNIVYNTGNQTIFGIKTFATGINIINSGNPQNLKVFNKTGTNTGEYGIFGWNSANELIIGSQQTNSGVLRDVTLTGGNININPSGTLSIFNSGVFSLSGASGVKLSSNPLSIIGSGNTYVQVNIQNAATGSNATADLVVTANNGTDSSNYINLGINNSGYNDSAFSNGTGLDGYLFINGGSLDIGTQTSGTNIEFHVGGTTSSNITARFITSGLDLNNNKIINAAPDLLNVSTNFNITGTQNARMILANSATLITGTIVSGNITGFNATIIQIGAGQIQITGSGVGVLINSYNNQYKTAGQYAGISLLHTGNNGYLMYGNTAA